MPVAWSNTVAPEEFSVEVADPNPFDKIYVRWISDYPPYSPLKSKLLYDGSGTPDAIIRFQVPASCDIFQSGTPSPHRLLVVVADREFKFKEPAQADNPEYPFESIKDKAGFSIEAGWLVSCP